MRSFRGTGKGAETPTKAETGKLKWDDCLAEDDCFLFRVPRAGIISFEMFVFPTRGLDAPPPREARHLPGTPGRDAPPSASPTPPPEGEGILML